MLMIQSGGEEDEDDDVWSGSRRTLIDQVDRSQHQRLAAVNVS